MPNSSRPIWAGIEVRSRLFLSESCPLILPFHVELDRAREALADKSGSTDDQNRLLGAIFFQTS